MNSISRFSKIFFPFFVLFVLAFNVVEAGTIGKGSVSIFNGNDGLAKEQALRNALRSAVEQGVGVVLESKTRIKNYLIINDEIYSSAQGYITSYKTLISEKRNKEWYVEIDAEVSTEKIKGKLSALRILHKKMGNKRFVVLYNPTHPSALNKNHRAVSEAQSAIQSELIRNGFRVFHQPSLFNVLDQTRPTGNGDENISEWIKIANSNMVETIVELELFPTQKSAISDPSFAYSAVWITAQLKAYDVASGVIMATLHSEQKQLTTAKVNSYAWESEQAKAAIKAGNFAASELIERIVAYYQSVGDIGESFLITFKGFNETSIDTLLDILESLDGYQSLKELQTHPNEIIEYFTSLKGRRLNQRLKLKAQEEGIKYDRQIENGRWIITKK
ncbi:MAG: hypothetical protein HOD92_04255 [Deltaproteobacteria bacterium]|jgi:hypothetical protein|nr:hypothetical protein [Deltaproteobacteria bacterium]MBT4525799.1 hypothetical protein [Deltaproteobacteria bacterium]